MKLKEIAKKYPEIISLVQFGSSVSGDTYEGSDIDLLVVVKNKKVEKRIENKLREELDSEYQIHVYNKNKFLESVKERDPLNLSAIHTGKVLLGNKFVSNLLKYKSNKHTARKCMLNSFAALGLGFSDLMHGMFWDSVNSIYHAARSSIWAALMEKEITPPNKKFSELLGNKNVKRRYQEIIDFRKNIPSYDFDLDLEKKFWEKGSVNKFTGLLKNSCFIIKKNYGKIFGKNFIDPFKLMRMLRKNYEQPNYYAIMLSVNWKKMFPFYHVLLSYEKRWVSVIIDAHNGKIKEKEINEKKNAKNN